MVRITFSATLMAASAAQGAFGSTIAPDTIASAYIIEYEYEVLSPRVAFTSLGEDASVRTEFKSKIFKGVAVDFNDSEHIDEITARLTANRRVKQVWPIRSYTLLWDNTFTSIDTDTDDLSTISKRQAARNATDTFSPHVQTQVNKLRDAGIKGKGVRVGIIDTGIDYLHPALGGCFGQGCLVFHGYDFVGDNYSEATPAPEPDEDPIDECYGHGTHVAGIIAAQSDKNTLGVVGAAEEVTLGAYRVFGCAIGNKTTEDILIAAYIKAWEDGNDIISASIGKPQGWADGAWDVVVSRIVAEGVPCLLAAGNGGLAGIFYAVSAGSSRGATAIGSVDNTQALTLLNEGNYTVDDATTEPYLFNPALANWTAVTLPLWAAINTTGNTPDASLGCIEYPDSTPDLSGYLVLIRAGICSIYDKVRFAADKGGRYLLLYDDTEETYAISLTASSAGILAAGMVPGSQGRAWIKALASGSNITVTLPNPGSGAKRLRSVPNMYTPGLISLISSWGPTFEVNLKPQFLTPGGGIISTFPRRLGSYAIFSGTSMSCPLAAAIYALLINVRDTRDPKTLESLVSSTSKPILWKLGDDSELGPYLAPAPQQGAGLVQAWDAAYAKTLLGVSSISFNDTEHFVPMKNFSIHNTGSKSLTYKLDHVPAGTIYTLGADGSKRPLGLAYAAPVGIFASLAFSPSEITIPAGERRFIMVTATPPAGLDPERLPVYSGYITINGTDGTALSLPYLGVAGALRSIPIIGNYTGPDTKPTGGVWISRSNSTNFSKVPADETFLIPAPGSNTKSAVYLSLAHGFNMGSNLVHAIVVPANNSTTLPSNTAEILGLKSIGEMMGFPRKSVSRKVEAYTWTGQLSTGGYAPAGAFKIVVKALRIFGDDTNPDDWDTVETQGFTIEYV